ncbi:phosphoribosylformylglycinamidine synthase [Roseivirga ehrenbergii]|uniref:Phosphoribosylformylglycinamidine synthase n=1 Tax=Roseivirga ehrenbergii (strain DSM 102268 / JCM 13514 / KCTC 12282 / NCIMB 14502 / KMM 6017) TaxID=279360 RepID=A0A150X085_ROSEK|nr:phosphoribosylformylglycinamidine synthase [Roseivirga ehrenbergii]KYG72134.1 phosphoribosylformylglycinamidine synthase [Roseivirga ehrenbergii]TCL13365.1 phosphoribosylformylglycinamidine synthase [Roseivirga ehrenbergii]
MIQFFDAGNDKIYALGLTQPLQNQDISKLSWLFGNATLIATDTLEGNFVGPRKEMITPWSTNAVEITQNMGVAGIERIEEFDKVDLNNTAFDPMLQAAYKGLDQQIYSIDVKPEPVLYIEDIAAYNQQEGLALNQEEIDYLNGVSEQLGRKLTDGEVFGFSQVNSEHCRHKIFNGVFIIDGQEMPTSLFKLIRKTSEAHPGRLVSAYKDNVAFVEGPRVEQFAQKTQDKADWFETKDFDSVISLKAETHNFPTTVEPFNGAATGAGGEIRDRMAGGKGSMPLAGTAVYMTSYSRLERDRNWEANMPERKWLYQTPMDILIKASNGASDFGNKFGQPLIAGSVLTFEHQEADKKYGFDKVIMLAGGVGYGKKKDALKESPAAGDKIVVMGGDNYRIGMGGSAVSSVDTGEFSSGIELNAIQRSNPEMQKRVYNAVRAMAEMDDNPIVSIHDHGAGGHLNCLSELVEETGGTIDVKKLPVGDPTLSDKEIIGNESQERMGLVMKQKDIELMERVAKRERAPFYVVGETTGDQHFKFENKVSGENPIDWNLSHMFGSSPKTILEDKTVANNFADLTYDNAKIEDYLKAVLQLEAVACKDWLTNKVDRCVTGRVAKQQTAGPIQLPLNNVGVMALDYRGIKGIATSIGHAPVSALVDPVAGSQLSIAEALTNIIWAPIEGGIKNVSLSANWMWPAKNEGENARLYKAVEGVSQFAIELGINIPTGKDSMSMTQKYENDVVYSPGTVIISAVGEVTDLKKVVEPVLQPIVNSSLLYIDLSEDDFKLGGSSFAQIIGKVGTSAPMVKNSAKFAKTFDLIQTLIEEEHILAGHDISAGGMVTALLEMCFAQEEFGLEVDLSGIKAGDDAQLLFSEKPGLIIQIGNENNVSVKDRLKALGVTYHEIAVPKSEDKLSIKTANADYNFDILEMRDLWYKTSFLLDQKQSGAELAKTRFENYKKQPLEFTFPQGFEGQYTALGLNPDRKEKTGIKGAIIREKGVNGDREMAYAMHLAGFDVKDIHMTDLISGAEDLSDVNFIAFVGGFSNSDVLGSAKGWAGAFLYNEKAKAALDNFYAREDTISLGICNGCQLMGELGLLYPEHKTHPKLKHNIAGKFESGFVNVTIPENDSVMLGSLSGARLGIWVAHGEGRFALPEKESAYNVIAKYSYEAYPASPNGSDYHVAGLASKDGRHLAIMPHFERSIFPWNWAHYPIEQRKDILSPWIKAFINAKEWVAARA